MLQLSSCYLGSLKTSLSCFYYSAFWILVAVAVDVLRQLETVHSALHPTIVEDISGKLHIQTRYIFTPFTNF